VSNKKHRYAGQRPRVLSQQDIIDRICRNGITEKDLEAYYKRGVREGREMGLEYGYESAYAPLMLALHRLYGFGQSRLMRVAEMAAEIQIEHLTNEDTYKELEKLDVYLPRVRDTLPKEG
jgi:hypothetical protein